MIINKIVNSYDKFFTSNNYSYSVQNNYTNMESQIITIAYKDNKKLTSFSNANSIYSITWQDFSTKEQIDINPASSSARISTVSEYDVDPTVIISSIVSKDLMKKIKMSFIFFITTETIDGQNCYVLQPLQGIVSNTYYFNIDTGMVSRVNIGGNVKNFKDWKLNEVTEEMITRPDLTSYTII